MTWIVEDPLYVMVLGIAMTAILGFGWMQTSFRPLGYAAGGTVIVTLLLVMVEQWIVTDTEQITDALHRMAHDVQQNDVTAILNHIHASAKNVRRRAEHEFPKYEFTRCDIKRNLQIQIDASNPSRATATFNVVVVGQERGYPGHFHAPRYVELTLRKDQDRWQVADYRHAPPQRGFLRQR